MEPETKEPSPGEILIIEDTLASLQLLASLLGEAGYAVRTAQDGELGLLSAQARAPDLILLDIRMPGMNGFEVCRRLKADPNTASVPVIFLTALQDAQDKVQGLRLGAVDYITKPYQAEEVLARTHTCRVVPTANCPEKQGAVPHHETGTGNRRAQAGGRRSSART